MSMLLSYCYYDNKRNAQKCAKPARLDSYTTIQRDLIFFSFVLFLCHVSMAIIFTTLFLHELDGANFDLLPNPPWLFFF